MDAGTGGGGGRWRRVPQSKKRTGIPPKVVTVLVKYYERFQVVYALPPGQAGKCLLFMTGKYLVTL